MNGASKILTVSYGTFSCTLEGFDDPFNTMKAIAEYFRDLAADDRYFGAEPPTPDAAMLHRIAEREIQRRVEAKVGEHGIVLKAGETAPEAIAAPQAAEAPARAEAAQAPIPALATAAPAPSLSTPSQAAPAVESAAARLMRLRAAQAQIQSQTQAQAAPVPAPAPAPAPVESYVEDQEAEAPFSAAPITVIAEAAQPAPVVDLPAADMIEDVDQPATVAEDVAEAAWEATPQPFPEVEAEDSIANVLAALAPTEEPAVTVSEVPPEPALGALRETLAGLMAQDDQLAEDMAEAALPQSAGFEGIEDAEILPEDSDTPELAEIVEAVIPVAAQAEEAPLPEIDDIAYLPEDETGFAPDDASVAASAELALAEAVEAPVEEPVPAPEVALDETAPVVADKLQRARARVIKIRRLDKREKPVTTLSPEDEADLAQTLAGIEAEVGPAPAPVVVVAEVQPEPQPQPAAAPAENPLAAKADDAAVDRLMAEANQQLEVPEIKRRRSAIAHLKAAVLATVADRKGRGKPADPSEAKAVPYHQDLDRVVRPLAAAPASDRPAPLVLVSAQRIYTKTETTVDALRPMPQIVSSTPAAVAPQGKPVLPVRPRRLSGGSAAQAVSAEIEDEDDDILPPVTIDASKQSFGEFAEALGANSLAEMLEAAGAYCTLVLDRPSFTRPLLFQQIAQVPQMAEVNREDSLRNFGKLLREGRFTKTVRGQFALADTSPILTEAKRLAG